MMHFPPCFRFSPYFRKIFRLCGKFSKFYLFPKNLLIFNPLKFLMTFFLVIEPQISNPPYFPCFSTFPPVFAKIITSPYFSQFLPCFRKIDLLFTYFLCI